VSRESSRLVNEDLSGGFGLRVLVGSFDELAVDERGAGADERDEVWGVDRAPAVLGSLDELPRVLLATGSPQPQHGESLHACPRSRRNVAADPLLEQRVPTVEATFRHLAS
jgi:hypothetical protein